MELIKFSSEIRNNRYLTVNQLEHDIEKLKSIFENKNFKFDYVKRKKLKNYVNELKRTVQDAAIKIRDAAIDKYKSFPDYIPKRKPRPGPKFVLPEPEPIPKTDLYLLLGFLLSLDDNDFDEYDLDDDELLEFINKGNKKQSIDKKFRQALIRLPYKAIFDTIQYFPENTYIMEAILNQIFSFLILSVYLMKDNKACFPSIQFNKMNNEFLARLNISPESIFISLGTGFAIDGSQWNNEGKINLFQGNDVNIKLNTEAAASYTSMQILKNLLQTLYREKVVDLGVGPQGFVGYTQDENDNKYSKTCAHVWGANIDNYNIQNGGAIKGGDHADSFTSLGVRDHDGNVISIQSPGVFGIISTNFNMEKHTDKFQRYSKSLEKRKWIDINDEYYVLFYNVLKTIIFCNYTLRDRQQLIGLINTIMINYIGQEVYYQIIDKLMKKHLLFYENTTVPTDKPNNEINIRYERPNPLMIIVVIKNETSAFYFNDKFVLLDVNKLKNACTKTNDNTFIFFNFEDLEEYIINNESKDPNKVNEELLRRIKELEDDLKQSRISKTNNSENKAQEISRLKEMIDIILARAKAKYKMIQQEKLDADETARAAEIRLNLISHLHGMNRERLSGTQKQLAETQEQLSGTQEQLSGTQEQLAETQEQLAETQEQLEAQIAETSAETQRANYIKSHAEELLGSAHLRIDFLMQKLISANRTAEESFAKIEEAHAKVAAAENQSAIAIAHANSLENTILLRVVDIETRFAAEIAAAEERANTAVAAAEERANAAVAAAAGANQQRLNAERDASAEIDRIRESATEEVARIRESATEEVTRIRESAAEEVTRIRESAAEEVTRIRDSAAEEVANAEGRAVNAEGRAVNAEDRAVNAEGRAAASRNEAQLAIHNASERVTQALLEVAAAQDAARKSDAIANRLQEELDEARGQVDAAQAQVEAARSQAAEAQQRSELAIAQAAEAQADSIAKSKDNKFYKLRLGLTASRARADRISAAEALHEYEKRIVEAKADLELANYRSDAAYKQIKDYNTALELALKEQKDATAEYKSDAEARVNAALEAKRNAESLATEAQARSLKAIQDLSLAKQAVIDANARAVIAEEIQLRAEADAEAAEEARRLLESSTRNAESQRDLAKADAERARTLAKDAEDREAKCRSELSQANESHTAALSEIQELLRENKETLSRVIDENKVESEQLNERLKKSQESINLLERTTAELSLQNTSFKETLLETRSILDMQKKENQELNEKMKRAQFNYEEIQKELKIADDDARNATAKLKVASANEAKQYKEKIALELELIQQNAKIDELKVKLDSITIDYLVSSVESDASIEMLKSTIGVFDQKILWKARDKSIERRGKTIEARWTELGIKPPNKV